MATLRTLGASPTLLRQAESTTARLLTLGSTSTRLAPRRQHSSSLPFRKAHIPPQDGRQICIRCFSQTAIAHGKAKAKQAKRAAAKAAKEAEEAEEDEEVDERPVNSNNPNLRKKERHTADAPSPNENSEFDNNPRNPKPDPEAPDNFFDVTFVWDRIDKHHVQKIKEVTLGGRFTETVIGSVPVFLDKTTEVPLRDLAVTLPAQGRTVQIRMHSPDYRRAIMSAIQASDNFNQQPQLDPDDDAVLLLKLEPERPEEQLTRLKRVCNDWRDQLRRVSGKRSQTHKDWRANRLVLGDVSRKLDQELTKMQAKKMAAVDATEKDVAKQIQKAAQRI